MYSVFLDFHCMLVWTRRFLQKYWISGQRVFLVQIPISLVWDYISFMTLSFHSARMKRPYSSCKTATQWNCVILRIQSQRIDSGRSTSETEELVARGSMGTASPAASGSAGGSAPAPNGSTYVNYQDDDECIDETFDSNTSRFGGQGSGSTGYVSSYSNTTEPVVRCVALYSFQVSDASCFFVLLPPLTAIASSIENSVV